MIANCRFNFNLVPTYHHHTKPMKVFICYFLVATFATLAMGDLATGHPSLEIEPLDWTANVAGVFPFASFSASGDLLAYYDNVAAMVAVKRRNSEGGYELVANFTRYAGNQVRTARGKWIWAQMDDFVAIQNLDDNNQLTGQTYMRTIGGSMLSDDTFVGYYTFNGSPGQIRTYQYQAEYNNWTVVAEAALDFSTSPVYSSFDMQSYRAYDNHLVITDLFDSTIKIYLRQADKSWSLNDTIPVHLLGTNKVGVHFNSVDTVVFVAMATLSDSSQGVVYIYTKKDGVWNEQMFNTTSVGYVPQGNLGASCAFIDQNTLLVSAGTANYYNSGAFQIGKVLMLTRTNGGDWTPYLDIIGRDSDVFGLSIAVNDYDLVVYDVAVAGINTYGRFRVYTAPLCFAQPINVTCNNEQIDDCSSLTSTQLYTVNQSPRCGEVSLSLNGVSLVNQTLQASFTFTRFETETFSCNATVTCPAPVVPVAPVAPTPVAVSVPVKAPTTATTSDGSMIQCFGLAIFALFLAFF